jgi:hypothetical protein
MILMIHCVMYTYCYFREWDIFRGYISWVTPGIVLAGRDTDATLLGVDDTYCHVHVLLFPCQETFIVLHGRDTDVTLVCIDGGA